MAAAMGGLGDVSVIRDILMGGHISGFNQRFEALEALVAHNERLTQERLDKLQADTTARFERLEALLAQNVEMLTQRMDSISKNDRHQMADLLIEVSKHLKK